MSDPGVNEQPGANGDKPAVDQPQVSPGVQLANYRQERGWTVEQVASQLNLAPRQILALERDDYSALPGMAIVRGFIRAYAKLLKVDAAPLLATLGGEAVYVPESVQPRKVLATPFSDARLPSMTERTGLSSKWVLGALLIVLLGVMIWSVRQGSDVVDAPKVTTSDSKAEQSETAGTLPNPQLPEPVPESPQTPVTQVPPVTASNSELPAPAVSVPAAAPQTPVLETQASAGKDILQLKVREDSWIEIRRASSNAVVLSRIVKAGETVNVEISEPVSVVFGNAAGVDATLRGVPLELNASTSSNVARLNLK